VVVSLPNGRCRKRYSGGTVAVLTLPSRSTVRPVAIPSLCLGGRAFFQIVVIAGLYLSSYGAVLLSPQVERTELLNAMSQEAISGTYRLCGSINLSRLLVRIWSRVCLDGPRPSD
jgi:hypothetical protein